MERPSAGSPEAHRQRAKPNAVEGVGASRPACGPRRATRMAGMPGEQPPAKGLAGPEAAWQGKETTDDDAKRGAAAGSSARGTSSTTRPAHSSSKSTTTSGRAREKAKAPAANLKVVVACICTAHGGRGSSALVIAGLAVRRHAEGAAARSGTTGSFCPCGTRVEQAGRHDVAAACLTACGCRWLVRTESRCGVAGCADSRTSSGLGQAQSTNGPSRPTPACSCARRFLFSAHF